MTVENPATPLRPGQRYRVWYRGESQHLDRIAVMVFLGEDGDTLLFDARPVAGTQHLPRTWLRGSEPVPTETPACINRIRR